MEPNYVLDEMATAKKIINGDMPDAVYGNDSIIGITDNVARIYLNLLSKVVLGNIPEGAAGELVDGRILLFDKIAEAVNICRYGRLFRLANVLTPIVEEFNTSNLWPNNKMKNNVSTFISDFWFWSEQERQSFLVIVDYNEVQAAALSADEPNQKQ